MLTFHRNKHFNYLADECMASARWGDTHPVVNMVAYWRLVGELERISFPSGGQQYSYAVLEGVALDGLSARQAEAVAALVRQGGGWLADQGQLSLAYADTRLGEALRGTAFIHHNRVLATAVASRQASPRMFRQATLGPLMRLLDGLPARVWVGLRHTGMDMDLWEDATPQERLEYHRSQLPRLWQPPVAA